jgi:hypothetical protein
MRQGLARKNQGVNPTVGRINHVKSLRIAKILNEDLSLQILAAGPFSDGRRLQQQVCTQDDAAVIVPASAVVVRWLGPREFSRLAASSP